MSLLIEAPTDSQLAYIKSLCDNRGWQFPEVVCSKQQAGEIIDAIKACTYRAERYAYPFSEPVPFR